MAKLSWNNAGERYFEAGVDRGVLYLNDAPGVPWNGLVSVSEEPSGGEPQPYYIDGVKYLNVATAEEFQATINAFTAPREFAVCDGTYSVANGLFVTQQPRKSFAFCYRTRIGNDIKGVDFGYKLHVVYTALAAPSQREYGTISDSMEPGTLSWSVTTTPPSFTGFRPTAHFVVDSTKTPKGLMAYIENILYGDEDVMPRLPSAQELTDLFSSDGPVLYRNLVKSPIGPTAVAGNLNGMRISASEFMDLITDDGFPVMEVHDDVGHGSMYVDPITNFADPEWVGKYIAMAADIRPMDLFDVTKTRLRLVGYNSVETSEVDPTYVELVPGEYTRVSTAMKMDTMPAGGYVRALIWPDVAGNQLVDPNFQEAARWKLYATSVSLQAVGTGMTETDGSVLISSSVNQDGLYAMGAANTDESIMQYGVPAITGQNVIISAWVRGSATIPIGGASVYCRIYDANVSPMSRWSFSVSNTVAIDASVWTQIKGIIQVPDDCIQPILVFGLYKQPVMTESIRWSTPEMLPQQRLRIRNYSVAVGDTKEEALAAVANPVSGDMDPDGTMKYSWEGEPNNSPSVLKTWGELP